MSRSPSALPVRVGVIGARGRMGKTVCEAVKGDSECELVAELDLGDSLDQLTQQRVQVVVDFTSPDVVMDNIAFCIKSGINVVVGTSGFTAERMAEVELWLAQRNSVKVLIAPNFSVGAVLMTEFAAMAAPYFESVEIVELHHPEKLDAPSGTSIHTAAKVAKAREHLAQSPDATLEESMQARGVFVDGIPIHSLRVRGLMAHQEVILGGVGETLTIRHDSMARESFMPGVLLAIKEIDHLSGLTVGLAPLLLGP
jgi:4-hydroxy-tetrahydrodipicolinate reductase